jgi:hypothetical protein
MEFKLGPPPFSGPTIQAGAPAEPNTVPGVVPRRALPIVLIATGAVAGCGGGKEQVTAAELAQKGDQICREEQSRFDQIQAHPPPNASVAADQTKELIDVAEAANSDLGDLEPPESLQGRYEAYLESRDGVVDEMKKGADAAESQDGPEYSAAQTAVAKDNSKRRRQAASLGFKVCSANPGSV